MHILNIRKSREVLKTEINSYHIDGDHLTLDGVCEKWLEILWTRRFFKGDEFTISLPPTEKNIALFSEGKVIELAKVNPLTGASEHAGIITGVAITSGEKAALTISGQSFDGLLDRRILSEYEYGDTAMTVFRKNAGDLANAKRRFAATVFDTSVDVIYSANGMLFKTLVEYGGTLASKVGFGLQSYISHDGTAPHIVIGGRQSVDRSIAQTAVKRVIFSDEYDTASDFERQYSDNGVVTGVVVGSKLQHNDNTHIDVEKYTDYFGDAQSYDRIEKYQSITPVTKTEMRDKVEWTVLDDWNTFLAAKDLSETCYVSSTDCFGANVIIRDGWESKFNIGDIVTVQNTAWNAVANKQVTEVREYWGDSVTVTATLGEPQKTLSEIIGGGSSGGSSGGGSVGAPGVAGKDGTSCTHSWDGTTLTVTSASGTSSANLKGEKGDRGAAGTAAGFGAPTATVDANVGTPSVTVTASGANTAKVFNFAFKNLKGDKGDKGDSGADIFGKDSGANITLDDACDAPLVLLNIYGKSTQDGIPTPANPVDIVSVGDSGNINITTDNNGDKSTTASITSALPLCGIPVSEGGNYTDSNGQQWICNELIYNADGTGKVIKRVNKKVLSTNDTFYFTNAKSPRIYFGISDILKISNSDLKANMLCNNHKIVTANDQYFNANVVGISQQGVNSTTVYISNANTNSVDAFKTWLAVNPTYIIYQLATPQEIALTSAEMTALRQLQTFDGVTNITNDSGADMDVKYWRDATIPALFKYYCG